MLREVLFFFKCLDEIVEEKDGVKGVDLMRF